MRGHYQDFAVEIVVVILPLSNNRHKKKGDNNVSPLVLNSFNNRTKRREIDMKNIAGVGTFEKQNTQSINPEIGKENNHIVEKRVKAPPSRKINDSTF